jgi:hypothetical protein
MDAQSRRRIEMGDRVLSFNSALPDTEAGYNVAVGKLQGLMGQASQTAATQLEGRTEALAASARKEELRRAILAVPIAHLAEVGRSAARENHELGTAFRFKPGSRSLQSFRVAARGMQLEAETHRDLLAKHGLSESVLARFGQMLDDLDAAIALGIEGRSKRMGATAQLKLIALEIGRTVRVMDARNRHRFEEDGQALGQWLAASTVLGRPRPVVADPAPEGEVRPAA